MFVATAVFQLKALLLQIENSIDNIEDDALVLENIVRCFDAPCDRNFSPR